MLTKHANQSARGFTLLEVLVASSILSFSVLAVIQAVSVAQGQTYQAIHDQRATALAEAFLEEVTSKPYDDPEGALTPGPDAGETTRGKFDNIDDYHGFVLNGLKTPADVLTDVAQKAYPDCYQKFIITIDATYGTVNVSDFGATLSGITVTVTVQDKTGRQWQVSRFVPEPATP